MDDDEQEEVEVLERGGGMGTENSESRMREVGRGVRVCWDLWGRVARPHRDEGGGW